jgi:hypothetical protein
MRLLGHQHAPLVLLVAGLVAGAAAAVGLGLQLRGASVGTGPTAATQAELGRLSDELGRPVFWLGPPSGRTLELSRTPAGRVFLRYLPAGRRIGEGAAAYPTVATYPVANAYGVAVVGAQRSGGVVSDLPGGAALITYVTKPRSAYYVERGVDAQIEVFDPQPGRAAKRIRSGELRAVPSSASLAGTPGTASAGALEALPKAVGHPVYWAGPERGATYELTRPRGGGVFVRYLPPGVDVGDPRPGYLTIATYPGKDAFDAAKAQAGSTGARIQELPGGGLLISPRDRPRSAYLVSPAEDVQVEVYAAQPGRAAALIRSGAVVRLG